MRKDIMAKCAQHNLLKNFTRLLDICLASAKKQVLMVVILLGFSEFTSLRRWSCFALLVQVAMTLGTCTRK
ncbi:hypothetical protein CsSME_00047709 [Camellia sinensis var. sinensis]